MEMVNRAITIVKNFFFKFIKKGFTLYHNCLGESVKLRHISGN